LFQISFGKFPDNRQLLKSSIIQCCRNILKIFKILKIKLDR